MCPSPPCLPITVLIQFWDLYWVALTVELARWRGASRLARASVRETISLGMSESTRDQPMTPQLAPHLRRRREQW
jgi:hypothetical protein